MTFKKTLGSLVLAGAMAVGCGTDVEKPKLEGLDAFADCLTEEGAVLYSVEGCYYCQLQKHIFGDSFQYITMVDCDKEWRVCQDFGINGYPAWIVDGEKYGGFRNLRELEKITECVLEE